MDKNFKGGLCLTLSVRELLESKGIKVKENHLSILEDRWKGMQALKGNLENAQIDDADIGLRNIPRGGSC